MGLFDFSFSSGKNAPQQSVEVRSDEPELPTPNVNEALIIPTRSGFDLTATPEDALGYIPINRAVGLIVTAIMQLSLDAYKAGEVLETKPALLERPDVDNNLPQFLEQTTYCLTGWGNAFWQVFKDNQGRTTGLRVLDPSKVVIDKDGFGYVRGYQYAGKTWTKKDIQHLAIGRLPGKPEGQGPIQLCQAEIRGMLDLRDYSANWFQDSGVPTGILKTDRPLNAEQAKQHREQWEKSQGGSRGTAVLGDGLTYTPVYLTPEQAMWLEGKQSDTTAVARMFGVPASLLLAAVEGSSMTYSNVSQVWVEFARFTLARYVIEIEQAFTAVLPRGTEARFNLEALLRPDATSRWAIHSQALAAGAMSINEVREIENLPAAPDGDFKTAEEKQAAFDAAQEAPGPGDTTQEEEAPNE